MSNDFDDPKQVYYSLLELTRIGNEAFTSEASVKEILGDMIEL